MVLPLQTSAEVGRCYEGPRKGCEVPHSMCLARDSGGLKGKLSHRSLVDFCHSHAVNELLGRRCGGRGCGSCARRAGSACVGSVRRSVSAGVRVGVGGAGIGRKINLSGSVDSRRGSDVACTVTDDRLRCGACSIRVGSGNRGTYGCHGNRVSADGRMRHSGGFVGCGNVTS